MRTIVSIAKVDETKCDGCHICERVCPTASVKVEEDFIAHVNLLSCTGCGACEERCPRNAIMLSRLDEPRTIGVDWTSVPFNEIEEICHRAHMSPHEIICFCTGTRAKEVAAAIILGSRSPEEISAKTGARTGCKVECIQPILRLLVAAGVELGRAPGYQWYGKTPTLWDLSEEILMKPEYQKYHLKEDKMLLERIISAK